MRSSVLQSRGVSPDILKNIISLDVYFLGFDGTKKTGKLLVHKALAEEVRKIFEALFSAAFPIAKIVPLSRYSWSDDRSMRANNTTAFNYRFIEGTDRLSFHAFGCAIDINPVQNPCFYRDGNVRPIGCTYNPSISGTLSEGSSAVRIFDEHGWTWGGRWSDPIDYQHFQKIVQTS